MQDNLSLISRRCIAVQDSLYDILQENELKFSTNVLELFYLLNNTYCGILFALIKAAYQFIGAQYALAAPGVMKLCR